MVDDTSRPIVGDIIPRPFPGQRLVEQKIVNDVRGRLLPDKNRDLLREATLVSALAGHRHLVGADFDKRY